MDTIAHDLQGSAPQQQQQQGPTQRNQPNLFEVLQERKVKVFSFDDWLHLDAAEVERGALSGKPREKCVSIPLMLARRGVQWGSCLD